MFKQGAESGHKLGLGWVWVPCGVYGLLGGPKPLSLGRPLTTLNMYMCSIAACKLDLLSCHTCSSAAVSPMGSAGAADSCNWGLVDTPASKEALRHSRSTPSASGRRPASGRGRQSRQFASRSGRRPTAGRPPHAPPSPAGQTRQTWPWPQTSGPCSTHGFWIYVMS